MIILNRKALLPQQSDGMQVWSRMCKCATHAHTHTYIYTHKRVVHQVASIAEDVPDAQYHAGMGHLQAGNYDQAKYRWERWLRETHVWNCDSVSDHCKFARVNFFILQHVANDLRCNTLPSVSDTLPRLSHICIVHRAIPPWYIRGTVISCLNLRWTRGNSQKLACMHKYTHTHTNIYVYVQTLCIRLVCERLFVRRCIFA